MDRVHLAREWRGRGLGAMLACEAIHRLMPGCRAVACSPGLFDHDRDQQIDQAEWDRVLAQIVEGWERIGFQHYRENVYLLSPAWRPLRGATSRAARGVRRARRLLADG